MSLKSSKKSFGLLYLLGLGLLLCLAYWQYSRGQEKIKIAEMRAISKSEVLVQSPNNWQPLYYRDVQLQGGWLTNDAFLLENRIKDGQVGFEVLTPFKLAQDQALILVNRGWVKSAQSAKEKPTNGATKLNGTIYLPETGVVLGDPILPEALTSTSFPKRSLYIDMPAFSKVLKKPIEPVIFVLDEKEPMSFARIWKASVMTASKHMGYAVQWLGLALVFMIYGVIWFRKRA